MRVIHRARMRQRERVRRMSADAPTAEQMTAFAKALQETAKAMRAMVAAVEDVHVTLRNWREAMEYHEIERKIARIERADPVDRVDRVAFEIRRVERDSKPPR